MRTFKRSKELDQIRVTETIFNNFRQLDRELTALPASSHNNQGSKGDLYSRILNTVDWLSFLINTEVITDRRMIVYMKSTWPKIIKIPSFRRCLLTKDILDPIIILRIYIKEWNRTEMKNSIWLPKDFDKLIYDHHKQNLRLPVHVKIILIQ